MSTTPDGTSTPHLVDLRILPGGGTQPSSVERLEAYRENIARALGVILERERFGAQFSLLLSTLGQWLASQEGSVETAYLSTHEGSLLFLVVARAEEYPDDLRDALTDLEIELTGEPGLDMLSVRCMVLPKKAGPGAHTLFNGPAIRYVGNA